MRNLLGHNYMCLFDLAKQVDTSESAKSFYFGFTTRDFKIILNNSLSIKSLIEKREEAKTRF
jgi:hypothetical protein